MHEMSFQDLSPTESAPYGFSLTLKTSKDKEWRVSYSLLPIVKSAIQYRVFHGEDLVQDEIVEMPLMVWAMVLEALQKKKEDRIHLALAILYSSKKATEQGKKTNFHGCMDKGVYDAANGLGHLWKAIGYR